MLYYYCDNFYAIGDFTGKKINHQSEIGMVEIVDISSYICKIQLMS